MLEPEVVARCRSLTDSQIVEALRQALFAGLRPEDYVLATIIFLVPDRLEELTKKLSDLAINPSPIPPVFPKSVSPL